MEEVLNFSLELVVWQRRFSLVTIYDPRLQQFISI